MSRFIDELCDVAEQVVPVSAVFGNSKSKIPPTGDGPFVSIRTTGGTSPSRTQNLVSTTAYQNPSAQIIVRATSSKVAEDKARELYDLLAAVRNTTLSGTYYIEIVPNQEPYDLGLDGAGRSQFVFNIQVKKRPS